MSPEETFRAQGQRVEARDRTFMVVAAVSLLGAIATYVVVLVFRG